MRITHAECAGVSGPGYYAAGPRRDVLGRLCQREAVLMCPAEYMSMSHKALPGLACSARSPGEHNGQGSAFMSQERGHPLHQNARALITSGMSSRLHLSKAIRARLKRRIKAVNANCT